MFATRVRRAAAATSLVFAAAIASGCDDSKSTAPDVPAVVSVVQGSGESVIVGSTTVDSLEVLITTAGSDPAQGLEVNWKVTRGDGTVSAEKSVTDNFGRARVAYTPGHIAGTVQVEASITSLDPAVFTIVQTANTPTDVETVIGEPSSTVVGGQVRLSVRILDEYDNPVQGATVHWIVSGGNGIDNVDVAQSATDDSGVAFIEYTPLGNSGARTITASVDGGASVDIGVNVLPATIVAGTRAP